MNNLIKFLTLTFLVSTSLFAQEDNLEDFAGMYIAAKNSDSSYTEAGRFAPKDCGKAAFAKVDLDESNIEFFIQHEDESQSVYKFHKVNLGEVLDIRSGSTQGITYAYKTTLQNGFLQKVYEQRKAKSLARSLFRKKAKVLYRRTTGLSLHSSSEGQLATLTVNDSSNRYSTPMARCEFYKLNLDKSEILK